TARSRFNFEYDAIGRASAGHFDPHDHQNKLETLILRDRQIFPILLLGSIQSSCSGPNLAVRGFVCRESAARTANAIGVPAVLGSFVEISQRSSRRWTDTPSGLGSFARFTAGDMGSACRDRSEADNKHK